MECDTRVNAKTLRFGDIFAGVCARYTELINYFGQNERQILKDIEMLVKTESPSDRADLLKICSAKIQDLIEDRTGLTAIVTKTEEGNDIIRFGKYTHGKKHVLILAHYDTVFPAGTLENMPFTRREGIITGPGVFDMKTGLIMGLWAVKFALENQEEMEDFEFIITPDEEVGSTGSRSLILEEARNAIFALVLEPSEAGKIKTGRKGVANYEIIIHGKSAHAGLHPEQGISAINEMSRIVLKINEFQRTEAGTAVNVGYIEGGTRSNVVPAYSRILVDVRTNSKQEIERIDREFKRLRPENTETVMEVNLLSYRPPMVKVAQTDIIVKKIKIIGKDLGLDIEECSVGGASDGNIVSETGVPVIDGMGAVGGGAHSESEYVIESSIRVRTAFLGAVIMDVK